MISIEFFQAIQQWQADPSGSRHAAITMGNPADSSECSVWVYDYGYLAGAIVRSIEDLEKLDLKDVAKQKLMADLAKLEG